MKLYRFPCFFMEEAGGGEKERTGKKARKKKESEQRFCIIHPKQRGPSGIWVVQVAPSSVMPRTGMERNEFTN